MHSKQDAQQQQQKKQTQILTVIAHILYADQILIYLVDVNLWVCLIIWLILDKRLVAAQIIYLYHDDHAVFNISTDVYIKPFLTIMRGY